MIWSTGQLEADGSDRRWLHTTVKLSVRAPKYFTDLVKNTYRVLLTRGLKGCYVYFTDLETREYMRARMVGDEEVA